MNTKAKNKIIVLFISILIFILSFSGCSQKPEKKSAATPISDPAMYDSSHWTAKVKNTSKLIMSQSDIIKFNAQTLSSNNGIEDIFNYSSSLTSAKLTRYIKNAEVPDAILYYENGEIMYQKSDDASSNFPDDLNEMLASNYSLDDIPSTVSTHCAIAVNNGEIKAYPFIEHIFTSPTDRNEDIFLTDTFLIGEPMIVLYTSTDELWYFVQTLTCRGWVLCSDLALTDKSEWLNFVNAEDFLLVTDLSITVTAEDIYSSPIILKLGTKLPLYKMESSAANDQEISGSYIVKYPIVNESGYLEFSQLMIPLTENVHKGYLDFTSENVVELSLQLAGQKLNPNGINGGWDSNSFFTSIYSCFGIYLPDTIEKIRNIGTEDINLIFATSKDILKSLDSIVPGTLLFTNDSAGIYLGKEAGKYYVLHPAHSFFVNETRYTPDRIIITDTDIVFDNGSTLLNSIDLIKTFALS